MWNSKLSRTDFSSKSEKHRRRWGYSCSRILYARAFLFSTQYRQTYPFTFRFFWPHFKINMFFFTWAASYSQQTNTCKTKVFKWFQFPYFYCLFLFFAQSFKKKHKQKIQTQKRTHMFASYFFVTQITTSLFEIETHVYNPFSHKLCPHFIFFRDFKFWIFFFTFNFLFEIKKHRRRWRWTGIPNFMCTRITILYALYRQSASLLKKSFFWNIHKNTFNSKHSLYRVLIISICWCYKNEQWFSHKSRWIFRYNFTWPSTLNPESTVIPQMT